MFNSSSQRSPVGLRYGHWFKKIFNKTCVFWIVSLQTECNLFAWWWKECSNLLFTPFLSLTIFKLAEVLDYLIFETSKAGLQDSPKSVMGLCQPKTLIKIKNIHDIGFVILRKWAFIFILKCNDTRIGYWKISVNDKKHCNVASMRKFSLLCRSSWTANIYNLGRFRPLDSRLSALSWNTKRNAACLGF